MALTMVPDTAVLPDVLPTERLLESGKPVPAIRQELRRIDDLRNAGSVLLCWAQAAAIIGGAMWLANPLGYLVAAVLMGATHARFAILGHEAAHKLLFTDKRANDWWAGGCSPIRPSYRSTPTGAATSPTTRTSSGPTSPT